MRKRQRYRLKWSKGRRRSKLVLANSINSLLPMLFTPVISLLIIRRSSEVLWGAFVGVLIIVQLGAHIASWGNSTYLLRAFSRAPTHITHDWGTSLFTRLLLVVGLALIALFIYPPSQAGWIILWGMALFLHQSCAVLITYQRDFLFSALVEGAGLIFLLTAVLFMESRLTVDLLIQLFALSVLGKAISLLWRYRRITWGGNGRFQSQYFALAFPFFLLGFSGMLNSRVDLYAVNFFLTAQDVAEYQVFTSFLLYLQALAGFILLPFVKNIYRLEIGSIYKLAFLMLALGLLVIPSALFVLNLLLRGLYQIELSPLFFLFGGLMTLPVFFNLPIIYALYKKDKQMVVLMVNITAVLINLWLNFLLLPRWGLIGAVVSTAIVKWLSLVVYAMQSVGLRRKGAMI